MKPCVFCQILEGRLEAQRVYEDASTVAFLDHRPLFPGHVLVVPRRHLVTLGDLHHAEIEPFFRVVRLLSRSVPLALGAEGSFTANNNIVSQSVLHLHWHVIPRVKKDGLKGFFWPRVPYRDGDHSEQVRAALEQATWQEEILDFWYEQNPERWWNQDPAFDDQIRHRFGPLVEQALRGDLDAWHATPRGSLALILLLDQFPRNMHRHQGRCFDGDERAQRLVLDGLEKGYDGQLPEDRRVFYYMPLEHAESAELQKRSLACFEQLGQAQYLDFARRHADIIFRFGRYPHRNQALGRASTAEEEAFLREPGSSFW